ncbi:MAG: membrane protein YqaA with SNARE-associated domain [Crocinitomix sp.]|jgi:membrane protein YqaA with SNARE-associated domain
MNFISWGLIGLFAGTFLSGSLIPFPSEALVLGAYRLDYGFWTVLIVATIGNFLGGLTNYWIGYKSNSTGLKKRFKLKENKIALWEKRLDKWGVWLGLLSWVPFVGDPMVAVLGFFKVRLLPLSVMMLIGKFARYFLLLWMFVGVGG